MLSRMCHAPSKNAVVSRTSSFLKRNVPSRGVCWAMERLNYNHLRCFWAVARDGSIVEACKRLGLTQPTISKQIGDLEEAFDEPLFRRTGRRLVLTDVGQTVYAYADDIPVVDGEGLVGGL